MNSALRETWRPFVGKTNGGADGDNGGKIVAMAPNKEVSHGLCTSDRNSLQKEVNKLKIKKTSIL